VIGVVVSVMHLALLVDFGLRPATLRQVSRWLAEDRLDRASLVASTAFTLYLAIGIFLLILFSAAGGVLLWALRIPEQFRAESHIVLVIAAGATALGLVTSVYLAALGSRLRFEVQHFGRIGGQSAYALLLLFGLTAFEPQLRTWALASLGSAATALWIARAYSQRVCADIPIRPVAPFGEGLADLADFSKYAAVFGVCQWLILRSGPLLLAFALGPEAVGLYMPALAIVIAIQPFWTSFLWQLQPLITEAFTVGDADRVRWIATRGTRYGLLLGGGVLVFVAGLALPFVELWLGPDFRLTAWVLMLWAAVRFCHVANGVSQSLFLGAGQLRGASMIEATLAGAYLLAAAAFLAWTDLGVMAVPVALIGSQLLRTVLFFVISAELVALPRVDYFRRAYLAPLACLAVLAVIVTGVETLMPYHPLLRIVTAAALGLPVYALLSWNLGLREEDREYARSLVSGLSSTKPGPDSTGN
jgi:O-antigen/teichoic acid export membrane protein